MPPQSHRTIGDDLSEHGIDWAWYAGGWSRALADRHFIYNGTPGELNFHPHHQPFNYFYNYAPGTQARTRHLKDGAEFLAAIDSGTLPPVSFYKPEGALNEHPGYATVMDGDQHLASILQRMAAGPQWAHLAVFILYDENGGWWDHVAPPKIDSWGPGTRIPAIIVSPFAKKHTVDHTLYDTTSILKFIARRFAMEPLPGVRAQMGDLTSAFDFEPTGEAAPR